MSVCSGAPGPTLRCRKSHPAAWPPRKAEEQYVDVALREWRSRDETARLAAFHELVREVLEGRQAPHMVRRTARLASLMQEEIRGDTQKHGELMRKIATGDPVEFFWETRGSLNVYRFDQWRRTLVRKARVDPGGVTTRRSAAAEPTRPDSGRGKVEIEAVLAELGARLHGLGVSFSIGLIVGESVLIQGSARAGADPAEHIFTDQLKRVMEGAVQDFSRPVPRGPLRVGEVTRVRRTRGG